MIAMGQMGKTSSHGIQDLFAVLDVSTAQPVRCSFEALQDKARRGGVTGLSAQEKADYLDYLQRKVAPQSSALPSPTPAEGHAAVALLPQYRKGQSSMTYAGIGSLDTPEDVIASMQQLAGYLEDKGYTLQTEEADRAFAPGCEIKRLIPAADAGAKELTLDMAREIHPAPWILPLSSKRLLARTALQIYGAGLDTPVDFVLCWTKDGCETEAALTAETGEPRQAIAIAARKGIPVINLRNGNWRDKLKAAISSAREVPKTEHG